MNDEKNNPIFWQQSDLFDTTPPKQMTWQQKYKLVISSKYWRKLREEFLAEQHNKCSRCGWQMRKWDKSRTLDLHHKTYERLGNERKNE